MCHCFMEMAFDLKWMAVRATPHSRLMIILFTFACFFSCHAAFNVSAEERAKNLDRLGFVAAELARAGAAVIAAPIAAKQDTRSAIQGTVLQSAGAGANFFTIHVATPLEHCESTDRKGVYTSARKGDLKGIAGVDEEYEVPERADLTVDVTKQSVPEIVHSEYLWHSG